jgi:hypothetical protein
MHRGRDGAPQPGPGRGARRDAPGRLSHAPPPRDHLEVDVPLQTTFRALLVAEHAPFRPEVVPEQPSVNGPAPIARRVPERAATNVHRANPWHIWWPARRRRARPSTARLRLRAGYSCSGRPTGAPLGRARCVRCMGMRSARASSRSEGARPPSLSQRGTRENACYPAPASAIARRDGAEPRGMTAGRSPTQQRAWRASRCARSSSLPRCRILLLRSWS